MKGRCGEREETEGWGGRGGSDRANEEATAAAARGDGEVAPATRHTGDISRWTAGEFRLTVTAPPSHSRGCKQVNMESVDAQWSNKWSEITHPATVNSFT